jgi:hypothetical protein
MTSEPADFFNETLEIEATSPTKNGKVVPVHMKACTGNRDVASLTLNLDGGCG